MNLLNHFLLFVDPTEIDVAQPAYPSIIRDRIKADAPDMISILATIAENHTCLIMFFQTDLARFTFVDQFCQSELIEAGVSL